MQSPFEVVLGQLGDCGTEVRDRPSARRPWRSAARRGQPSTAPQRAPASCREENRAAARRARRNDASSSSVKKGLPSDRSSSRSTSAGAGASSRIPATCSRSSARVNGSSSTPIALPLRSSSSTNGRSGCPSCELVAAITDDQRDLAIVVVRLGSGTRRSRTSIDRPTESPPQRASAVALVRWRQHREIRNPLEQTTPATPRTNDAARHISLPGASSGSRTENSSPTEPGIASSSLPSPWAHE